MLKTVTSTNIDDPVGAEVVILTPVPKSYCTKQISKGKSEDKPHIIFNRIAKEFSFRVVEIKEPYDLFKIMESLQKDPYSFVIRGHPAKGTDINRDVRRIVRKDGSGTILPVARNWVTLDIDGISTDKEGGILPQSFHPDDPESTIRDVIELLPSVFHKATVHWRFSSSQGFKGNSVSMHLTFFTDTPVADEDLKRYWQTFNESFMAVYGRRLVDPALFNPIQPHYTAAPIIEGLPDPLSKRSGIIKGTTDTVLISNEWVVEKDDGDARRYIGFFDSMGDDKDGFHHPIMQGIASWISYHGEPEAGARNELKRLVRSYVDDANTTTDRPTSDVERYRSDPFLDSLIDGAVNKGFAAGQRVKVDLTDLLTKYVYVRIEDSFYDPQKDLSFTIQSIKNAYASMAPRKNIAQLLLEHPDLKTVDMLHYTPGYDQEFMLYRHKRIYNTWRGHVVLPAKNAASVKPFTDHLSYLVDGNKEAYDHLSAFIAHIIAHAGTKIRHAVVLGSKYEGTGKSYLKTVLKGILGPDNFNEIGTDQLKEQFNNWIAHTECVFIEELMAGGRIEMANHLKPLISESTVTVRKMRTDSYVVDNYASFIATTNHRDAMVLSKQTRRYWVWFSDVEPKTRKYYYNLFKWTKENLPALTRWALEYDFSKFDPDAPPPKTDSFYEMAELSEKPLVQYIREQIDAEDWPFRKDLVVVGDMLMSLRGIPGFGRISPVKLSMAFREIGLSNLGQKRFPDGSKPRVWAVRNNDEWEMAEEAKIAEYYEPPGRYEDRNLNY